MAKTRFSNPRNLACKYEDFGYKLLEEARNDNITSWRLKKEVSYSNTVLKGVKGIVKVNITSIYDMKRDGSSYGTAIAEIAFPAVVKDNEITIKDVVFEYDRTPEGLVLKKFEKLESSVRVF